MTQSQFGATTNDVVSGGLPVGAICLSPFNLTDSAWLPCDFRPLVRALYPLLSACLPKIGTFTATSRTKGATPTGNAITNNGTVWCVTGAVGTSNIHTTSDGITYTPRTTGTSADTRSILSDGTNIVAANAASSGSNSHYSTNGGTTWAQTATAVVLAPTGGLQTCMTWAPSLGTVGRFCVMTSGGVPWTSDDRGVTWTQRNGGAALGAGGYHVCWTGTKFIATTGTLNTIYTSTDGITWVAQTLAVKLAAATAGTGSIVSDGNGKVLILEGGVWGRVLTSTDHGANWSVRNFSQQFMGASGQGYLDFSTSGSTPSFTNGRFFITGSVGGSLPITFASADLVGWAQLEYQVGVTGLSTWSHKSGVYLVNADNSSSSAFTLTEDTNYMRLPHPAQMTTGNTTTANNLMPFIKVQ